MVIRFFIYGNSFLSKTKKAPEPLPRLEGRGLVKRITLKISVCNY